MLKKSHYVALGTVALLALILLNLPGQMSAQLKLAIGGLFLPLFGLTGASQQLADRTGDALLPRSELAREKESFRRENQQLRIQAMQAEQIARENEQLRRLVGWQQQTRWNLKLARVILRDPASWWRTVWIDFGTRDHARENLPVVTPDGLVGRIVRVSPTSSQVVLLGDPACNVAAFVENDTHDAGVVGAAGPLDSSLVEMRYLPPNASLKAGQRVFSSDVGGLFPKGILIGNVVDTQPVEYGLYTRARVKLAAHLGSLEEVWVLFP